MKAIAKLGSLSPPPLATSSPNTRRTAWNIRKASPKIEDKPLETIEFLPAPLNRIGDGEITPPSFHTTARTVR